MCINEKDKCVKNEREREARVSERERERKRERPRVPQHKGSCAIVSLSAQNTRTQVR